MSSKSILSGLIAVIILVVFTKIFFLSKTDPVVNNQIQTITSKQNLPEDILLLKNKIQNNELDVSERMQSVDQLMKKTDKDLAITVLEDIEKDLKNMPIGDYLRKTVVSLRFGTPMEKLKKN